MEKPEPGPPLSERLMWLLLPWALSLREPDWAWLWQRSSGRDREPDPLPRREAGSQKANVNQQEWEGQAVKTVI